MVFARIVVAYNDTPAARRALQIAVQLAREAYGTQVIAVAVARSLVFAGDSITEIRNAHTSGERACTGWLSSALAYADDHDVTLATEIRIGLVARQLAHAVAVHRADLLVIGRSERPGPWRRLIGTTGEKASHYANCSILIAR